MAVRGGALHPIVGGMKFYTFEIYDLILPVRGCRRGPLFFGVLGLPFWLWFETFTSDYGLVPEMHLCVDNIGTWTSLQTFNEQ